MVSSFVVTIFIFDYGTISSLFLRIFRRLRILLIICLKRSLKSAKFKCSHLRVLVSIRLDENVRQQRVQKTFRQEHVKLVFQMFGNWTFWKSSLKERSVCDGLTVSGPGVLCILCVGVQSPGGPVRQAGGVTAAI